MSYRITNIEKWRDSWFTNLSPHSKLLFIYLCENCNNAGIYEVNKKFILTHLGFSEQELMESIQGINKSYIRSNDGTRIWIINFLKHQKKVPLNEHNNNHKQIISIIKQNLEDEKKFKGVKELQMMLPDFYLKKYSKKKVSHDKENDIFNISVTENKSKMNDETFESKFVVKQKKFIKPTIDDIQFYMQEKNFLQKDEASRFFNFFESNGWKVGRNSMKNWKSSVNNWISNWKERHINNKSKIDNLKESSDLLKNMDWNKLYNKSN